MSDRAPEMLLRMSCKIAEGINAGWSAEWIALELLEAMKEPTSEMVNAYCRLEEAEGVSGLVSGDAWQAMLNAAWDDAVQ